jgi:hypothetical protein
MKKPNHKQSLLAFLSSRAAAGEGSLKTWGRGQRPPVLAHQAERLADELVAEGLATVEERDSGRVWRLVRQEEAAPAPAPVEEEPVLIAGDAAPSSALAPLTDGDRHQIAATLLELRARVAELESAADADYARLCRALDLPPGTTFGECLNRARLLSAARAPADPGLDEAAVAQYLLLLPEERWTAVAQARRTLTAARDLAARAREMEAHALASVDRLLSTPAGEAPVKVPEAPTPAETSSRGRAGSKASRVEAWLREHGQGTAAEIGPALGIPVGLTRVTLNNLFAQGRIERAARGVYRTKVSAQ